MKQNYPLALSVLLGLVLFGTSGCTQDFRIRRIDTASSSASASTSSPISQPSSAQGWVRTLQRAGTDATGRTARRAAAGRLLAMYGAALLTARDHRVRVTTDSGQTLTLTLCRGSGPGGMDPAECVALEPADDFVVDRVDHQSRTAGEGVPLVATLQPVTPVNSPGVVPAQPIAGESRALTAVATVSGHDALTVSFFLYDPRTVPGPLAAEYTTATARNLARFRPQKRGMAGLLRGNEYFAATGLYPMEKPTPDKAPLVLVHGLISDPGDFYHLENDLAGDAEVRRRYQVWVFYYPTSLPVVYSAMLLREDVDRFIHQLDPGGTHPALHRAVLVGHSMGGLLCRIAVSEGGGRYYHHFFRKPPDELDLSDGDRTLVRRALLSPGTANVAQVVFISTPHRGSRLASGPLGGLGRLLLHMPSSLQDRMHTFMVRNQGAMAGTRRIRPESSLDSLTPHSPVIAAVNDVPFRPGVHLHSIIGNRGHSGRLEKSSDGIVPYASSHLPQAESEVAVPAGHTGALARPETSAEVIRILHTAPAPE